MNTDTGRIYEGLEQIATAQARGEPVVRVSRHVADTVRAGQKAERKRKRKMARQSKRRNR